MQSLYSFCTKAVFLCVFVFSLSPLVAQQKFQPAKFTYKGKEYLVYPFRMDEKQDVPPCAFSLPDGDYIVFRNYEFKTKDYFDPGKLVDTLKISAFCTIKNNLPEGKAEFFQYALNKKQTLYKKKPYGKTSGVFVNGIKQGTWTTWHNGKKTYECNFKDGMMDGYELEWDEIKGYLVSKNKHKEGHRTDTCFSYYPNGKVSIMYDYFPERERENDTIDHSTSYTSLAIELLRSYYDSRKARTFYREYSDDGKLLVNIKLEKGTVIYFDSVLYTQKKIKKNKYHVNSNESGFIVKKTKEETGDTPAEFTVTYIYKPFSEGMYEQILERKYRGDFRYYEKGLSYHFLTHKQSMYEQTWINQNEIPSAIGLDTIISTYKSKESSTFYHFVPCLEFGYTEYKYDDGTIHSYNRPASLDFKNGIVLVNDTDYISTFHNLREQCSKKMFISDYCGKDSLKKEATLNERENGYLPFYEMEDVMDIANAKFIKANISVGTDYGRFEHLAEILDRTMLQDRKPFTGQIYMSNGLKKEKAMGSLLVGNGFLYENSVGYGSYLNGKKEGKWEDLVLNGKQSKYIPDLLTWFKKNAKKASSYTVSNNHNGKLNGPAKNYSTLSSYMQESGEYYYELSQKSFKDSVYLKTEMNYVNDTLDGPYKTYFPDKTPRFSATFKMGKMDGKMRSWYQPGKIEKEAELVNGLLNGKVSVYREDKVVYDADYSNGVLNGHYKLYNAETSNADIDIEAVNDILKTKRTFYPNGSLKEEVTFNDGIKFHFSDDICAFRSLLEGMPGSDPLLSDSMKIYADYNAYYENSLGIAQTGKLYCNGKIKHSDPVGLWNFYDVAGNKINEVAFKDTSMKIAGRERKVKFMGKITGFYNDGKIRCKGLVYYYESGYDCTTHLDKTSFLIHYTDAWTYEGVQFLKDGNGKGTICDENGVKQMYVEYRNYAEEGIWKYYDPNGKLHSTGKYIGGLKEGLWFEGDLEGMNFEDAACFDPNNKNAQKVFEYSKKVLNFTKTLYKNGEELSAEEFDSDLNKERLKGPDMFRDRF